MWVLIVLAILFALSQLFNNRKDRSFKAELIKVDTAQISRIVLHPQADAHTEIEFNKSNSSWTARQGTKTVAIESGSLDGLLKELSTIKVKSIVTQSKDKLNEYEISDSTGSRITVYAGSKKTADFYSGKFGFNPQTNSMISYIREAGENTVYAIDGFQSMVFNAPFSNFRDKTITKLTTDQLTGVTLSSGVSGVTQELQKSVGAWTLNGQSIQDTLAVTNYVNGLQGVRGNDLVDDITPQSPPIHSLTLNGIEPAIKVQFYATQDSLKPFLVQSSQNPNVFFREDSTGAYQSLIKGLESLAKTTGKKQ